MEKAFVSTLKRLNGVIRDDAQVWEAKNWSRQRGYTHMGLVTTAKHFDFVQDPDRLCPAARREAEIVVLGAEQQRLALCREPTAFRTFYQQLEAAEKDFPALASPMDLPAHMAVFNAKLKMALEKAIGLSSWKCGAALEQETLLAHGREIWRLLPEGCPAAFSAESNV